MKRRILVYTLFITLIIIIFCGFNYLKTTSEEIIKNLNILSNLVFENEFENANKHFTQFKNEYEKKLDNFSVLIHHEGIRESLLCLSELSHLITLKHKDVCLMKLDYLKYYIEHIFNAQVPKLLNIF